MQPAACEPWDMQMTAAVLLIDRIPLASGSVETWTLNDPASRNALSEAMVDALLTACERAAAFADLRGVVLRGAGGHFCAGGSLGGFAKTIGQPLAAGEADPLVPLNRRFGTLLQALCALPQWLIVAVEGAAMGGGFGLVCCADHVLAPAETPLPALLDEAAIAFSQALRGPEAPQGLAAFAARKAPPWSAKS